MNRTEIVKMLSENRDLVGANLNDIWRQWAEDMIAAGVDRQEVAASMVCVALVQGMQAYGATHMVQALRRQAELFELAADHGVEYPAAEPFFQ